MLLLDLQLAQPDGLFLAGIAPPRVVLPCMLHAHSLEPNNKLYHGYENTTVTALED